MEVGIGLKGDAADARVQLLQPARRADKGAAGPEAGHEVGNARPGLLEDLRRWPEASALTGDPQFSVLLGK